SASVSGSQEPHSSPLHGEGSFCGSSPQANVTNVKMARPQILFMSPPSANDEELLPSERAVGKAVRENEMITCDLLRVCQAGAKRFLFRNRFRRSPGDSP